jgi:hypothetical protein
MPKPSRKRPRDVNELAATIVGEAVSEGKEPAEPSSNGRRRSGRVGGKARAEALSPDERSAIARKAAAARWGKSLPEK